MYKSSGIIGENINYIYYFTYFHEYSTHPYHKEFVDKIKGCVCTLMTKICCLWSSYCQLKTSVSTVRDNVKSLLESIDKTLAAVECSITRLDDHITKEVQENKEAIQQTIESIRNRISGIESILKFYAFLQVVKISLSRFNIHLLQVTIPSKIIIISLLLEQIKFLLCFTRKITITLKVVGRLSLQGINNGSTELYELNYKLISSETFVEVEQLQKIVHQLDCISESIKGLQTPLSLPSLEELKTNDVDKIKAYQEKIKPIEQHLQCLEETLAQLKIQKEQFHDRIKSLPEPITVSLDRSSYSSDSQRLSSGQNGSDFQASQKSETYYNYTLSISKTIVTCKKEIQKLLENVEEQIDELLDECQNFWKHLENIREHLQELKTMIKLSEGIGAFKKALEDLETCLDYLIRDFLNFSQGTTICRLKRQIRDTTWECPETGCNSCLGSGVMTDKVYVLQSMLHSYSWLLLGHYSTLDTKVFISKLYRCILRVDDIVRIVQVVDCCCCVKGLKGRIKNDMAHNAENTVNSNLAKTCMKTYKEYVKKNEETQHNPDTLDRLADSDNNLNHLCLCLVIRHKLYPCILKTVTLLVQLELGVSGNIAKKFGRHSAYNLYDKHSGCNSYNLHSGFNNDNNLSGCNSYNQSVSMMLLLSTWVMIHLATSLQYRYKIEHDKVKCCTKDKSECKCQCNKNGGSSGSSQNNCCPCCGCENNGTTPAPTPTTTATTSCTPCTPCTPPATPATPTACTASGSGTSSSTTTASTSTTPKQCCCGKDQGSNSCRQPDSKNNQCQSCCCKCCCYCVCKNKRDCGCKCETEEHCFCSKYKDDCYYRWFISVILYICHLVDHAFSLGYWDIQHAIQLLSNLLSKLDAVCWESDRRCVTISDKGSGEAGKPSDTAATTGEQTQPATTKDAKPAVIEEVIKKSREDSSVSSSRLSGPYNLSLSLERSRTRTSAISVSIPNDKPSSPEGKPRCRCDNICKLCQNFQVLHRVIVIARKTFYWVSPGGFTGFGVVIPKGRGGSREVYYFQLAYLGPIINKITVTYYKVIESLQRLSLNECQGAYFLQFLSELSFKLLTHETFNPLTGHQIRYVLERESKRYTSLITVKDKSKKEDNQCLKWKCTICKEHKFVIPLLKALQSFLKPLMEGANGGSRGSNTETDTKDLGKRCNCKNCCLICLQSGDIILFITEMVEAIESYSKETKDTSSSVPKDTILSITQTFSITKVKAIQTNTKCQCTLVLAYFKYLLQVLRTRKASVPRPELETRSVTRNVTASATKSLTATPAPTTPKEPAPTTPKEPAPTTPKEPAPTTPKEPAPTTPKEPAPTTPKEPAPTTPKEPTPESTPSTTPTPKKGGEEVIFVGLKNIMEQFFDKAYFNCGCESVIQCCCCCKCEECGTGKKRKCNKNGHGHSNGGGNGGAQVGGGATEQAKCPCQEGDNKCCCNKTDGNRKCCNCTEAKPPADGCTCCCLSCCADKENEDKKPQAQPEPQQQQPQQANEKKCPCKKKKEKKKGPHCKNNKKYKDKRCCCKCCPDTNGEGARKAANGDTNGEASAGSTPPTNGKPTNPEKECCCCCKCKTKCKNGAPASSSSAGGTAAGTAVAGSGGNTNGCKCHNSGQQANNGHNDCNCYCCFVCVHEKSAIKSVCKQLAYELKSGILVLSKLASNLSIECCEGDKCFSLSEVGSCLLGSRGRSLTLRVFA